MDNLSKLLRLLDLEKKLKYVGWDELGLKNLNSLREEVDTKIKSIKNV